MLALAGTALAVPGCGGSSGGGGRNLDLSLLTSYDFAITSPAGAGPAFSKTRITPEVPADTWMLDAGTDSIHGFIDRNSGEVAFSSGSSFSVDWVAAGPEPARFSVVTTSGGSLLPGMLAPSGGGFAVTWGNDSILVTLGTTLVLQLNDETPVSISMTSVLPLDGDGNAPDWQRVGIRAVRALTEMLQQTQTSMVFLERIEAGELDSGIQARACDTFPGSPPAGAQAQGESVATQLGPGTWDSVGADCLFLFSSGSSGGRAGVLANGSVQYRNLQITANQGGAILSASFAPVAGIPGGVLFTEARLRAVAESSPGSAQWVFTGVEERRDGGFAISFSER